MDNITLTLTAQQVEFILRLSNAAPVTGWADQILNLGIRNTLVGAAQVQPITPQRMPVEGEASDG